MLDDREPAVPEVAPVPATAVTLFEVRPCRELLRLVAVSLENAVPNAIRRIINSGAIHFVMVLSRVFQYKKQRSGKLTINWPSTGKQRFCTAEFRANATM